VTPSRKGMLEMLLPDERAARLLDDADTVKRGA
jgi:hypothetical protein